MSISISLIALGISTAALAISTLSYRRKTGLSIRGNFSLTSTIECEDPYVSEITLENLKDKSVVIFSIYLKIASNIYIKIENFDDKPLILKAFEVYQNSYGPIEFYGMNLEKVKLGKILNDPKTEKKLILSTSYGKYVVLSNIEHWDPISTFFRNYSTAIITPIRTLHKDQAVGGNVKYIIDFNLPNGKDEIVLLHHFDYKIKRFNDFNLTQESLETKDNLESYLRLQMREGKLVVKDFKVHDLEIHRKNAHRLFLGSARDLELFGPFEYHFFGRIATWYQIKRQQKENKLRLKQTTHRMREALLAPTLPNPQINETTNLKDPLKDKQVKKGSSSETDGSE